MLNIGILLFLLSFHGFAASSETELKFTIRPAVSSSGGSAAASGASAPITPLRPIEIIDLATRNLENIFPTPSSEEDFRVRIFPFEDYVTPGEPVVIQGIIQVLKKPETVVEQPPAQPLEIHYSVEDEQGNFYPVEQETVPSDSDFFFRKNLRLNPGTPDGRYRFIVEIVQAKEKKNILSKEIAVLSASSSGHDLLFGLLVGTLGGLLLWYFRLLLRHA